MKALLVGVGTRYEAEINRNVTEAHRILREKRAFVIGHNHHQFVDKKTNTVTDSYKTFSGTDIETFINNESNGVLFYGENAIKLFQFTPGMNYIEGQDEEDYLDHIRYMYEIKSK